MFQSLLVFTFLAFTQTHAELATFPTKPNPEITFGSYCEVHDPDFSGYRYKDHMPYCERNVSAQLKRRIYEQYGIPEHCRSEYTVDHFIPLAMGGSNAAENLWPEHKNVKATRQNLEQDIYTELSHDRISQKDAVEVVTQAKMNPPRDITPGCH